MLIINQSLTTGIFPNKLKIAKVIPLLKKVYILLYIHLITIAPFLYYREYRKSLKNDVRSNVQLFSKQ